MKIGIIGAGQIGTPLARHWVAAGHIVLLANSRGPETLTDIASETGAIPVLLADAVKGVDVIVLSIPLWGVRNLPKTLFEEVPRDAVILDTSNYYPFRDQPIQAIENGMVDGQWVSEQIGRPVVKAFNSILAYSLAHDGRLPSEQGRIALPVSGDDPAAVQVALKLVEDAGFDAIHAGTMSESWRHQTGTPAYCTDLNAEELRLALTKADRKASPMLRERALEKYAEFGEEFLNNLAMGIYTNGVTNSDLVNLNRSLYLDQY